MTIIAFKEKDLVMLRLQGEYGYTNTWWRVLFIDNDETFIGRLERLEKYVYREHKIGDHKKFECDKVQDAYVIGNKFCYSDNVTICECSGLCKDK